MKNRKIIMIVAMIAAITLFTVTAFASSSSYAGYNTLKEVMKNSKQMEKFNSATIEGAFQIQDNGKNIVTLNATGKMNPENKEVSGSINISSENDSQNVTIYATENNAYIIDETKGDIYNIVNSSKDNPIKHKFEEQRFSHRDGEVNESREALMDYLMGDLKYQVKAKENSDGTKNISINLNENEIPVPLNLMAGVIASKGFDNSEKYDNPHMNNEAHLELINHMPFLQNIENMKKQMPELKQNVKFTNLSVNLNVDKDNEMRGFEFKATITGEDINGIFHEINLLNSASIKDVNSTLVDNFDTADKDIKIIDGDFLLHME